METALFFHNNMTWKKPTKARMYPSVYLCVCHFTLRPNELHLFLIWWMDGDCSTCFVCRQGMVLIEQAHSIQVA